MLLLRQSGPPFARSCSLQTRTRISYSNPHTKSEALLSFENVWFFIAGECQNTNQTLSRVGVPDHISAVVEKAIHGIDDRLARTQRQVFNAMKSCPDIKDAINRMVLGDEEQLPDCYRKIGHIVLNDESFDPDICADLGREIRDLLQINLEFCHKDTLLPHPCPTEIYCAKILDKDLRRDITQTDW